MIKLNYNYGFKWHNQDDIFVKGYIYDEHNNFYKDEKLVEYFSCVQNKDQFKEKLCNANGVFSVIIKLESMYLVAVDKLRTFPLFYYQTNDEYILSDDTYFFQKTFNLLFNEISKDELLSAGYTTDKYTMLNNVYQVQPGEYIILEQGNLNLFREFYTSYATNELTSSTEQQLKKEFSDILDNITLRLIQSLAGKMALIPLSGGYDSRLVATLLKKHNYTNVVCFTYGNTNSFEVEISKEVALKLGFKWYFIEYTENLIGDYVQTEDFQKYYKFAYNNNACFLLQDYFAIQYLHNNNLVAKNAVVLTGHSGDLLAGSQLPLDIKYKCNDKKIVNKILSQTYALNTPKNVNVLRKRIQENLTNDYAYSIVENFFINRKISRFIINSHRIYEFFGYEHRLPLWDDELTKFFKIIPYEYKCEPYFYEEYLLKTLFEEYDIAIVPPDKIGRNTLISKLKRNIKKLIPQSIVDFREKIIFDNINNVDYMSKPLIESSEPIIQDSSNIDKVIVAWLSNKSC